MSTHSNFQKTNTLKAQGSALRLRMIDQMMLRNMSERTIKSYVEAIKALAEYYRQSPRGLNSEQVQKYLLYLEKDRQLAWNTINVAFSAFRFFFSKVLSRPDIIFSIPPRRTVRQLSNILSVEEVKRVVNAPQSLKHRAFLMTVYGCGLRLGEGVRLKPEHIESSPDRMMVRVEQGKGRKDRYTILPKAVLVSLRLYWKAYRPKEWIFYSRSPFEHMPEGTAQKIYYSAKKKAGIIKGRGIHTLRHCFASHLLQAGHDIYTIKRLMGHGALSTTARYLHISPDHLKTVHSPLDELYD